MNYFIVVICLIATLDVAFSRSSSTGLEKRPGNGCQCVKYDCGCCLHLDIEKIKLNDTGCVNISYLPEQYGISLTFSIDNVIIINKTISARNPPPICFGVPHLEKEAGLCIDFYNLDITHQAFSGCIELEAELYHTTVAKVKLGCFKIPLSRYDPSAYQQWKHFIQESKVNKELRQEKFKTNRIVNILP